MLKRTVMHKEKLNVKVKILKSDFMQQIYKDTNTNKEYLLAGVLVKAKNGEDLRENGAFVVPISGIAYLDKLIDVGKEHKTPITVTKAELPEKITYVYKDRK